MKNLIMTNAAGFALAGALLVPALALAQTSAGIGASVKASAQANGIKAAVSASTTLSAEVRTRAKAKADTEIDRRIKAITDAGNRVQAMTKISADFKKNLTTNLQTQGTGLASLKTKIDADTDGATLRTDVQSITQSYRIFALVLPQARIAAAADREATILSMLFGIGVKLQARADAAASAGKDAKVVNQALVDMGTKLATAKTHAEAAVTLSAPLTPDNGDKDKMKANADALANARKEVAAAHADLMAARKMVDSILKSLKGLEAGTAATSSAQVR
jgi:hypothetical protein